MDEKQKQEILKLAKIHVVNVSDRIFESKTNLEILIKQLRQELIRARGEEREEKENVLYFQLEKQEMLGAQNASPYFFRCDVLFDDEKEVRALYFGKFPFLPENIYS